MFQAQYLPGGTTIYSPWFPRGGDYMVATVEVAAADAAGTVLTVQVLSKDKSDFGDGLALTTPTFTQTGAGRTSVTFGGTTAAAGMKDLVRFSFSCPSAKWVLFRMLPPSWFDAIK